MDAQVNTHGSESLPQNINSAILPGKAEKMKEAAVSICDNYLWIRMPRELDHHTVSGIRKEADQKLMSSAVEHMVFDFAQKSTLTDTITFHNCVKKQRKRI